MKEQTIAFIGGGNMASSLIGGLIADGYDPARLVVADPDAGQRDALLTRFGITAVADNAEAAGRADIVVLAVKPQAAGPVAAALAPRISGQGKLIISVLAGIRIETLEGWFGGGEAVVRAMPNTPAVVQSGATVLCANAHVSEAQHNQAESIMRAVGLTLWVDDENLMDAVTALSGSGPAYLFLVMEAMEEAGRKLGLPADTARLLTLQTAFGAAKMALESAEGSAALRARVTSPGGTTEKALAVLEEGGLKALFDQALSAAHARAAELSGMLGDAK